MQQPARIGRPPGDSARYRAIAADLSKRLASREWPVGEPMPSYRQLARSYGTGVHTIRRALKALAADGRVLIRPRRLPQVSIGASFAATLNQSIALVCVRGIAQMWGELLGQALWRGIGQSAEKIGSPLIVLQHVNRWRNTFPAGLCHLPLRGIILLGPFKAALLRQYESLKVPVVLVDQPGDEFRLHSVSVDNYKAAFDATSRLLALGHRRIAFIRSLVTTLNEVDPDSKERQAGFVAACAAAKLRDSEFKVFTCHHEHVSSMKTIIHAKPRFTVAFCCSRTHAIQTAAIAEDAGLGIPQDLSLISFQPHVAMARNWTGPTIDFEFMGRTAVNMLTSKSVTPQHLRLPTSWNEGDSLRSAR